jgi:plastocyanin
MNQSITILLIVAFLSLPLNAQSKTAKKQATPKQSPGVASTASAPVTLTIPKDSMSKGASAYGENPKVVKAGTQVTWKNEDTVAHTVTSDSGAFDSGNILPGQSWSYTFSQPGKFPYYCTLHGKQMMSGTIEVQ